MTNQGYFSLGPEGVQEVDQIAVFYGAATPFLIRKRKFTMNAAGGVYYLVGECYMYGLMDGECLAMGKERKIELV